MSLDPFARLHLFRIGDEPGFEIGGNLGKLISHVALFAWILRQIEQLRLSRKQRDLDQLPIAFADGAAKSFDVDEVYPRAERVRLQPRSARYPCRQRDGQGCPRLRQAQERWASRRPCRAACRPSSASAWPANRRWSEPARRLRGANLCHRGSSPFEAGGFCSSPTPPLSSRSSGDRAPVANKRACGPAIVAAEDDQRVVEHVLLLKRVDDPPDLPVELGDHRGVGVPVLDLRPDPCRRRSPPWALDRARAARARRHRGTAAWRCRGPR